MLRDVVFAALVLAAWLTGSALAVVLPSYQAAERDPYEDCRDRCLKVFEACFEARCAGISDDDARMRCWMECAGGETKDCYEACEKLPRLNVPPSPSARR